MTADVQDAPDICATRLLPVDRAEVFGFLADLENHWRIADRFVDVVSLDGPPGARTGGQVRIRGPLGVRRTARTRVDAARPTEEMRGSAELGRGTSAEVRWSLRPRDDGTAVTLTARIRHAGRADRLLLALGGLTWMRRRFDGALRALDDHLRPPGFDRPPTQRGGPTMAEQSLYERLGGVDAIALVVDRFSDAIVENPRLNVNPALREFNETGNLPRLKFMRTLWICAATGGPFEYTGDELEPAHEHLRITSEEFDEVGAEIARALEHFGVGARERDEVLGAIVARKDEVVNA